MSASNAARLLAAPPHKQGWPGVQAHVWLQPAHFLDRPWGQSCCWLWLLAASGRLHALRLDAIWCGDDSKLARLVQHFEAHPGTPLDDAVLGEVFPVPAATVVPMLHHTMSWGRPEQRQLRDLASRLDADVLEALAALEVNGAWYSSVGNYNRLALLPPTQRARRLQALTLFPPLVTPLLLDTDFKPRLFPGKDANFLPRAVFALNDHVPVLEAMDRGRDLIGALAAQYRVDRALVRLPLCREPWQAGAIPPFVLRILAAMPAHARPHRRADVESRLDLLRAIPASCESSLAAHCYAACFKSGWESSWRALHASFPELGNALRDCRDFLRAALEQAKIPAGCEELDEPELALAWMARRGLHALLQASARWHAQPLVTVGMPKLDADDVLEPLLAAAGTPCCISGTAELLTCEALVDEGEAMHHCVGSYFEHCLRRGTRIVHLVAEDGSEATAAYALLDHSMDLAYTLDSLRGRYNAEPSATTRQLAGQVERCINSEDNRERRERVFYQAKRECQRVNAPAPRTIRRLDNKSRSELAQVLGWQLQHGQQEAQGGLLWRGGIAGYGYGEGEAVHGRLAVGDTLELVREAHNPHDGHAVRIDWRGHKLGYVPRSGNRRVACRMDAGWSLQAEITHITMGDDYSPVHCRIRSVLVTRENTP